MAGDSTHSPEGLDPADWPGFRSQAHAMLDDIIDYVEHIRARPVWQPIPGELRARMRAELPTAPTELAAVHDEFMRFILPYGSGNAHPGFMGWVQGGGNPVGMLADMLAAGLNANLGGRDHMPIEVERQITCWVRQIFRFPESTSGVFVTGTSMANLVGILIARTAALGASVRRKGLRQAPTQLSAYVSAAAHSCIARAMEMSGLGSEALRLIPVDARHQIDTCALDRAIAADRAAGLKPFLIVGNAGTVDVGAIDDLDTLADIAQREALWFHVDGALGALAMLAPSLAPLLEGIERADSIALDFHKWGQVPYDAGFILVRDGALHRRTFASAASYLRQESRGLAAGSPWPCEFGPDLSRGFRALKTWYTLKTYGTAKLGAVIERTCFLARYLESRIRATAELELLAPVRLNIVCFRYRSVDANRLNAKIVADMHEGGLVAPSTTIIGDDLAIRAAVVNHRTVAADIDTLIATVLALGRAETKKSAA